MIRRWLIPGLVVVGLLVGAWVLLTHSEDGRVAPGRRFALQRLLEDPSLVEVVRSDWKPLELADRSPVEGREPERRWSFEEEAAVHWIPVRQALFPSPRKRRAGASEPGPAPAARSHPAAAWQGQAGLRFPQAAGAALWLLPLEPDTPFLFRARIRSDVQAEFETEHSEEDLEALRGDALIGQMFLFELHSVPDLTSPDVDLAGALVEAFRTKSGQHQLDPSRQPADEKGFHRVEVLFRSSVFTKGLLIAAVGGSPGWWQWEGVQAQADGPPSGAVDFDEMELFRLPLRNYLPVQDRSAQDDLRAEGDDPFCRKVKLLADVRSAILAPPASELSLPVELPRGRFRLWFSYGVIEERRPDWGQVPVTFRARLTSAAGQPDLDLLERTLHPARSVDQQGWQEFTYEGEGQGQAARLVLTTSAPEGCEEIAVFAEPRLAALPASSRPPNVILISLDTLRADHLGCYGYRRADGNEVSPRIDAFAAASMRFANSRTVASYTLPSHATMMTGQYPQVHGVTQFQSCLNPEVHDLLATTFARAGYTTAGFAAGGFTSYEHGFHHGFDRYSILDPFLTEEDPFRNLFPRANQRAYNDAVFARYDRRAVESWLEQHREVPFFLFVHSYIAHNYHPPRSVRERFVRNAPAGFFATDLDLKGLDTKAAEENRDLDPQVLETLVDLYDATIFAADVQIGALLERVHELGLWENTVIALTSDHGEEFGEHRGLLHGRTVYEEQLRIPLLLHVPGQTARVVEEAVDLTDLGPTLLAAAGIEGLPNADGVDLVGRLHERRKRSFGWAEVDAENLTERYAYFSGDYKLVHNPDSAVEEPQYQQRRPPHYELFHLGNDPGEQHNLLQLVPSTNPNTRSQPDTDENQPAQFPDLRNYLQQKYDEFGRKHLHLIPNPDLIYRGLSDTQRQHLEQLGYLNNKH